MRFLFSYIFFIISLPFFGQNNPSVIPFLLIDKSPSDSISANSINIINKICRYKLNDTIKDRQFEKIEYGVELNETINSRIEKFLSSSGRKSYPYPLNPFNPEDVNIEAHIYNQRNKKIKIVPGFYYQEFKRDKLNNTWINDTTSFNFRIRFCLGEVDKYKIAIHVTIKNLYNDTSLLYLNILKGNNPGFLELGKHKKHLRFSSTKKTFNGVGQVIPWTESDGWDKIPQGSGSRSFDQMYNALYAMENAKGNFTRFVAAPWFMQLDWEALGNYSSKMNHAWEFDRINDYCINKSIYYIFCAYLHAQLQQRTDEQDKKVMPGVRWEDNAYNDNDLSRSKKTQENSVGAKEPIDFYGNEWAQKLSKNYFRYIIARWGYSTSFSGIQLMSEIDETANYRDETINDSVIDHSDNRVIIKNWVHEMAYYIGKKLKSDQLISVAIINGINGSSNLWDPEIFNHSEIDFIGLHNYTFETSPSNGKIRNRNLLIRYPAVTNLNTGFQNEKISHKSYQKKCFIYDEFGHLMAIPRQWPEDKNIDLSKILNDQILFMIKQDLWFTLASGCAITGLDWWNYYTKKRQQSWRKLYPPILNFTKDIDFETINYDTIRSIKGRPIIAQRWPETTRKIERSNNRRYKRCDLLEAYTQVSSSGTKAFGWINNRSVNWPNLLHKSPELNKMFNGEKPYSKKYLYQPKDDDKTTEPIDVTANKYYFKIRFFNPKTHFKIIFYDTKTAEEFSNSHVKSNRKGTIKIYVPEMLWEKHPDAAFKIKIK